jgi:hypothetical protein
LGQATFGVGIYNDEFLYAKRENAPGAIGADFSDQTCSYFVKPAGFIPAF